MSAGKIIGYIFAGLVILVGVIYIWSVGNVPDPLANLIVGVVSIAIGAGLLWYLGRKKPGEEEVRLEIDLSGDVNLDSLKCESCGGQLSSENISMVAGAPVVSCPFCGTSYQLTEEPKW